MKFKNFKMYLEAYNIDDKVASKNVKKINYIKVYLELLAH